MAASCRLVKSLIRYAATFSKSNPVHGNHKHHPRHVVLCSAFVNEDLVTWDLSSFKRNGKIVHSADGAAPAHLNLFACHAWTASCEMMSGKGALRQHLLISFWLHVMRGHPASSCFLPHEAQIQGDQLWHASGHCLQHFWCKCLRAAITSVTMVGNATGLIQLRHQLQQIPS